MSSDGGSSGSGARDRVKAIFKVLGLAFAAYYVYVLVFLGNKVAFYYPYIEDQTIVEQHSELFRTHTGCKIWAEDTAREEGRTGQAGYACGKRCVYDEKTRWYECKKISRIEPI